VLIQCGGLTPKDDRAESGIDIEIGPDRVTLAEPHRDAEFKRSTGRAACADLRLGLRSVSDHRHQAGEQADRIGAGCGDEQRQQTDFELPGEHGATTRAVGCPPERGANSLLRRYAGPPTPFRRGAIL